MYLICRRFGSGASFSEEEKIVRSLLVTLPGALDQVESEARVFSDCKLLRVFCAVGIYVRVNVWANLVLAISVTTQN